MARPPAGARSRFPAWAATAREGQRSSGSHGRRFGGASKQVVWTSVICLEKLRNLSLGPMTLFQRPICVSIRLRWLYPVVVCQAMHPLLGDRRHLVPSAGQAQRETAGALQEFPLSGGELVQAPTDRRQSGASPG